MGVVSHTQLNVKIAKQQRKEDVRQPALYLVTSMNPNWDEAPRAQRSYKTSTFFQALEKSKKHSMVR